MPEFREQAKARGLQQREQARDQEVSRLVRELARVLVPALVRELEPVLARVLKAPPQP